jgi:5'-methylthioadenosine phosphorylase
VIPDQIYDNTHGRLILFSVVGWSRMSAWQTFRLTFQSTEQLWVRRAYCTSMRAFMIEGPRFSTKAESNARSWGMSIIGMTASPEAFLARDIEIN